MSPLFSRRPESGIAIALAVDGGRFMAESKKSDLWVLFGGAALSTVIMLVGLVQVLRTHGHQWWILLIGAILTFLNVLYIRMRNRHGERIDRPVPRSVRNLRITVDVFAIVAFAVGAIVIVGHGSMSGLFWLLGAAYFGWRLTQHISRPVATDA
jgi:uncharacterized membrane protein